MILYEVRHQESGRRYIGITRKPLANRWAAHLRSASTVKNKSSRLHLAIRKYGPEAFTARVLAVCPSWDYAKEMEIRAIKAFGTYEIGFNATRGGEGTLGFAPTEETRTLLSSIHKGRPKTEAHKAAIGAANRGKKRSPEIAAKCGVWRGKTVPDEIKEKRAAGNRGKKRSPETREKQRLAAIAREARKREANNFAVEA